MRQKRRNGPTVVVAYSLLALVLAAAASARGESIWVEGEDAARKAVVKHSWYDVVKKEGMSGGDWLSHYDARQGTAGYRFEAEKAGEYTFWWRGNPFNAKVAYRLNGGKTVEMDFTDKRGEYMISATPDHRFLAWVKVGKVALRKGANTIAFAFHSDTANHGGIDCFLFDDTGFVPSGALKPGTAAGNTETVAGADQAIWIEGEHPTSKSVTKHGWYDAVKKDGMSGRDWLSHYDGKPGTATYEFTAEVPGPYTFWWRGNVSLAKVSYRLNGGKPADIDFAERRGEYMVSEAPDHRFLAWVKVGRIDLKKGPNTVTFTFHSDLANHGGIDCFCFTRTPFVPSGADKPKANGPAGKAGPGDWFPVVFDDDVFSPESVIDVSATIEAPAGGHGFLKRSGADLKFEHGAAPVRFWGCGANLQGDQFSRERLARRARYLRKHGVNMVRQHPVEEELGPPVGGKLDPKRLDLWDFWCAELKKNGIYMTWSVFYGHKIGPGDGYDKDLFDELEVTDPARNLRTTYGLVNIEPKLQDLQLGYLKILLGHKNPYTGLRPVDDPGLAVIEFQNEDCVFFHMPLSSFPAQKWPRHTARLRQKFFAWARQAYGTEDALKRAWGGLRGGDSFARGELDLMGAYHLGADGPLFEYAGQTRRAGDYIKFLTGLQRGFYERREKELRALGFRAVTVTTAWRAGGPAADPANLYCDTAADMIDRHNYSGGGEGGHGIKEGKVNNESLLTRPGGGLLNMGMYQVEDRPFCCTEWTQLPPNQWKAEAAPLIAFYGLGLQGWDASYHFTSGGARIGDGWPGLHSYVTDTPHYIGQFPALSLAVRRGDVREAPFAAARRLQVADLFTGTDPLHQDLTGGGHDAKTVKGQPGTPVEALAVGKVTVGFAGGKTEAIDLGKYWDASRKTVRSMTGELVWDYGREVVTVRSPRTQAVIGRAGGQSFDLPGATVAVKTPFVSLLLTPLDDKPLAESGHVLITAMARDTQTNARYNADGTRLLQIGGPPLLMEPVQATVTLKGVHPKAVNVLDVYGVPTGATVKVETDGSFTLGGEYRTYYYEVKRP